MAYRDSVDGYEYYVCEILNNIKYDKLNKYVIIPALWIKCPSFSKDKMIIKYPIESTADVRKLALTKVMYKEEWLDHLAVKHYGTDSFEDARITAEIFESEYIRKCAHEGHNISKTTCTNQESGAPSSQMDSKNQQQTEQTNPENPNHYATRQRKAQFASNENAFKVDSKPVQCKEPVQSEEVINDFMEIESANQITEEQILFLSQDPQKLSKEELSSVAQEIKNMLDHATKCSEYFGNLQTMFENKCLLLKNMLSLIDNCNNADNNFLTESEQVMHQEDKPLNEGVKESNIYENVKENLTKIEKQNSNEKKLKRNMSIDENIDTIVLDEDNEDKLSDNILTKVHTTKVEDFELPPDYDEENSRWSLRYQGPAPELMELKKGAHVYVNKNKYINALHSCKDSSLLACILLVEVFSDNALKTCSLYSGQANTFPEKSRVPVLSPYALNCILDRVEKSELHKGGSFDKANIVKAILYKLQEIKCQS